jgi:hypothetical protein
MRSRRFDPDKGLSMAKKKRPSRLKQFKFTIYFEYEGYSGYDHISSVYTAELALNETIARRKAERWFRKTHQSGSFRRIELRED